MMDIEENELEIKTANDKKHRRKPEEANDIKMDGAKDVKERKERMASKKRSKSHRDKSKDKCTITGSHEDEANDIKMDSAKSANEGKERKASKKRSKSHRDKSKDKSTITGETDARSHESKTGTRRVLKANKKLRNRTDNEIQNTKDLENKESHYDFLEMKTMKPSSKSSKVVHGVATSTFSDPLTLGEQKQAQTILGQKETHFRDIKDKQYGQQQKVDVPVLPLQSKVGQWLEDIRTMEFKTDEAQIDTKLPLENRLMLDAAQCTHKSKQDTKTSLLSNSDCVNSNYVTKDSLDIHEKGDKEATKTLTKTDFDCVKETSELNKSDNIHGTQTHGRGQGHLTHAGKHKHKSRSAEGKMVNSIQNTPKDDEEEEHAARTKHSERKDKDRKKRRSKKLHDNDLQKQNTESDDGDESSKPSSWKDKHIKAKDNTSDDFLPTRNKHCSGQDAADVDAHAVADESRSDQTLTKQNQEGDKEIYNKYSRHKISRKQKDKDTTGNTCKEHNQKQNPSGTSEIKEETSDVDKLNHADKERNRNRKRRDKSKARHKKQSHRGQRRRKRKKAEEEDLTEYFCVYHMTKFKGKVERLIHEDCEDVITAEDWDIGQTLESQMKTLKVRHASLAGFADSMAAERKRMVALLVGNREDVEDHFLDTMEEYVAHLLAKQTQFTARLEEMHEAAVQTLDEQIRRCKMVRRNAKTAIQKLNQCQSFPEELMVVMKIKPKYRVYKEILHREFSASLNFDYQFKPNPDMKDVSHLNSIGNFYGYQQSPDLPKFPKVTDEIKKFQKSVKDIYIHNGETPDDTEPCCFSGCCMSDGIVLLTDWNNACVKMIGSNGTLLQTLQLDDDPWDIKHTDKNTFAVTVPALKKVYMIECIGPTMEISSSFDTGSDCFGLALFDKSLYVTCDPCSTYPMVKVFSLSGQLLAILKDNKLNHPEYITVEPANRTLFISEALNNTVVAVTFSGRELFRYSHPELLYPAGITTDSCGNVWVCGKDSGNVHQITSSGELIQIVMEDNCHIENPRAICFEPEGRSFIVTETDLELNGDFLTAKYQ